MSHTLTEGGQITTHRLRMLKQVIKVAFNGFLLSTLCLFAFFMSSTPKVAYLSLWYYTKATLAKGIFTHIEVSREFISQAIYVQNAQNPVLPIDHVTKITTPIVQKLMLEAYGNLIKSLGGSSAFAIFILIFFFYRGRVAKTKKHLSGFKISSVWWINWRLVLTGKASPIKIENFHS